MRSLILGGIFAVASATVAVAQDSTAFIAGDRVANAELSKIIEGARANGLPVKPIVSKVNYGILMKAAPPRIIAAARGTAARLEEARAALAPHPTESDIAAGELALSSNVSAKSLRDVRKAAEDRPVAVPLGLLSQLVVSGVEEPKAAKIVTDLIRKGASVQQLAGLGNDVNSDVQLGTKASNSLELRMNHLTAVLGVPSAGGGNVGDALTTGASNPAPPGKKKP